MTADTAAMASYISAIRSDSGAITFDRAVPDECPIVTDFDRKRNVSLSP